MRFRNFFPGLLILSVVSSLPAAAPRSKKDFILTPPIPPEVVPGLKKPVKGTLQILYQDGKIILVKVLETTGDKKLDGVAVRHVQEKYQLRPGASGVVRLPFVLHGFPPPTVTRGGDFTTTPVLKIPYELRPSLPKMARTSAEIRYADGKITQVSLMKSTGNPALDKQIVYQIWQNFRVKPGVTGRATLPIGIRL